MHDVMLLMHGNVSITFYRHYNGIEIQRYCTWRNYSGITIHAHSCMQLLYILELQFMQVQQKLIESLCDDQTHSSLVSQLASVSLISETDKETQLSSALDPRQRATSLLLLLDTENKPQHTIELIKSMRDIDEMKSLADEMSVQYEAMPVQHGAMEESDQYEAIHVEGI